MSARRGMHGDARRVLDLRAAWVTGMAMLAACGGPANAPVGSRVAPTLSAALAAAEQEREPWRCATSDGPSGERETLKAGERTWQVEAHVLRLGDEDAKELAIGVIADAGGSTPATLAALGQLRARMGRVDFVLALGGMGRTRDELVATLTALTDRATWPLVLVPGDLESVPAQSEAIAALRQRGAVVLDGRLLRRIELPSATIAVIAGAGDGRRLVAGADGCSYRPEDAKAALDDLTGRPGLRVVASVEAPRTSGGDDESGERALAPGAGQQIDVALHGPIDAAATPAREGNRDGEAVSISPGVSDAGPRLPEGRHAPSAGVLVVRGMAWQWRPKVM